ncbi:Mediator of RNA polymerase II transcription subunit 31 [Borealophlyctis nickersoniae]|nr:Mediator of RNA polymerase II transcription subunit 31 [Borealophlyctis nickersoniae]
MAKSLEEPGETAKDARIRFQMELEFVQLLSNPQYVQYLAQQGYFAKPEFLNYLQYLKYWQEPQYAKYICYPYCLEMLDLLQNPSFRANCASDEFKNILIDGQTAHWRWYRSKTTVPEHGPALDGVGEPGHGQQPDGTARAVQ